MASSFGDSPFDAPTEAHVLVDDLLEDCVVTLRRRVVCRGESYNKMPSAKTSLRRSSASAALLVDMHETLPLMKPVRVVASGRRFGDPEVTFTPPS
jgi:hypothetical protein